MAPQLFRRRANALSRVVIYDSIPAVLMVIAVAVALARSSWRTDEAQSPRQPVPFSHEHHVGDLGIDCRYCHTSVETSPFAGMPATQTCMTCHSQLWRNAKLLEPVRNSYRTGAALQWTRVYDLPDFVYFNHSVHIHKGVACNACHGRVDRLPMMRKQHSLLMQWCLDCHKNPAPNLTQDSVFDPRAAKQGSSTATLATHNIHDDPAALPRLMECSICHR